jgi:L-seryl-tRNA(Ser) seleniumtransferase
MRNLYAKMGLICTASPEAKVFRGPQCSGLLLGRKDLIEAALLNSNPREGAICRPMKVGKEEVMAVLTALETWLKTDEKKLYAEWNARASTASASWSKLSLELRRIRTCRRTAIAIRL